MLSPTVFEMDSSESTLRIALQDGGIKDLTDLASNIRRKMFNEHELIGLTCQVVFSKPNEGSGSFDK